ncbi:MAG: hypothetical protein B7Z75_07585 [Acidocella sp. 20-57-95]|nr:MAG: hypothetical protein B7Z75_07585 [Acidocella sp. 20-57-95]OYV61548.1 MAG: hypothetical protein B7Z71_04445 [Acidocella sp. 21-58-7]HQT62927.1 hypothetical protein [Acidocella sp.]HQU03993.1 hypothetical protein [Acidocella sp.]
MNFSRRFSALLQHYGLGLGLGVAVLIIGLSGLGFLIAAYFIWLTTHFAPAPAAAITGATLFILAALAAIIGARVIKAVKKPHASLFGDLSMLSMGIKLASLLVRRDPKKAVILAAIAGAVAEYVLSEDKT